MHKLEIATTQGLKGEDLLHTTCLNYLKYFRMKYKKNLLFFHVPSQMYGGNGTAKHRHFAKLKGMGWYSGIWDLIIWEHNNPKRLYIEFKNSTKLSNEQIAFQHEVQDDYSVFEVVKKYDEFEEVLEREFL